MTDTTALTPTEAPAVEHNRKTGLTDAIREAFAGDAPVGTKLRNLYKARPVATAGLAAVAGLAILGTLRGRR